MLHNIIVLSSSFIQQLLYNSNLKFSFYIKDEKTNGSSISGSIIAFSSSNNYTSNNFKALFFVAISRNGPRTKNELLFNLPTSTN